MNISKLKSDRYTAVNDFKSPFNPSIVKKHIPSMVDRRSLRFEEVPERVDLKSLADELAESGLTLDDFISLGGCDPGVKVM